MPCKFIAELGSNHNGSLKRARAMIDAAHSAGFHAVKLQLFKASLLWRSDMESHIKFIEPLEVPLVWVGKLADRAHAKGMEFGLSVFYLGAAEELQQVGLLDDLDFLKVASYELTWDKLLDEVAHSCKPMILSTGMATWTEIHHAVSIARQAKHLTLMHCVSNYSGNVKYAPMAPITLLAGMADTVGWSDHTRDPEAIYRAVYRWHAQVIELHLDLEEGDGTECAHSWKPGGAARLISKIRCSETLDLNLHCKPHADEYDERKWRRDPSDGLRPML